MEEKTYNSSVNLDLLMPPLTNTNSEGRKLKKGFKSGTGRLKNFQKKKRHKEKRKTPKRGRRI